MPNLFLSAIAMLFCIVAFAQQKNISGVVSDKAGTIPGVSVIVKGTTRGTQTDYDGKYTIKASKGETLVFNFIGMQTKQITIGNSSVINVTMTEESLELSEVVVMGYDRVYKEKKSVASTTVSSESLKNRPSSTVLQSLAGRVPGVNITHNNGTTIIGHREDEKDINNHDPIKASGLYNENDEDYGMLIENVFAASSSSECLQPLTSSTILAVVDVRNLTPVQETNQLSEGCSPPNLGVCNNNRGIGRVKLFRNIWKLVDELTFDTEPNTSTASQQVKNFVKRFLTINRQKATIISGCVVTIHRACRHQHSH